MKEKPEQSEGHAASFSSFAVLHQNDEALYRSGALKTGHGTFETPCFLPIATNGSLRALSFEQAADCGTKVVMANAWHIFSEAGKEKLIQVGGVHNLIGWQGSLFTDSGGYQVFSLRDQMQIDSSGVSFGSTGQLTAKSVIEIQKVLGSDIMLVLDDCAPFPCKKKRAAIAVDRTSAWARESMRQHKLQAAMYDHPQHLFGIVQGGVYDSLRRRSVSEVAELDFDGYGIGGLSIGMPRSAIRDMTALCCELLPNYAPRHLLGVGLPNQIVEGILDGADTFDCVLPIRKAQRGIAYCRQGEVRYKLLQPERLRDEPLGPSCRCTTCQQYSREQMRLLFREDKPKAGELAAIHNLFFYHEVLTESRNAIMNDTFEQYASTFLDEWKTK